MEDSILISRLLKNDIKAFDELFDKYSQKLYGFGLRYLKSESESEELVQVVFIKIWEKRNTLKKDASFRSYLFTIAYNQILKHFRTKAHHNSYLKEAMAISNIQDHSMDSVDYASILDEVDKLIDLLPEKRKQIFIQSRKDGLSSKQIAKNLKITVGTVDNNISEALKFLRSKLKNETLAITLFISLFF